jgi:thiol-disulfide isomerase/thioredoxin
MFKTLFSLCLFVCTVFGASAQEGGMDFFHGTWSEALQKAKDQNRLIFVDAYASWCGPCKRMAATVFPDKKAGDFFNKNFVNLKIDMEKPENEEFALKFPVSSYPTLMIIDETGKLVIRDIGAKDVDKLIEFGKKALSGNNKSVDFGKRYDAGERDPQFIHDYIVELNKARKPSLKVVNEYLRSAKPEHIVITEKIIFEGATEADSKVFERMTEQIDKYKSMYTEEKVYAKVAQACESTVEKAKQYKSEDLLNEAKEKHMKFGDRIAALEFAQNADKAYYGAVKDSKTYVVLLQNQQKELMQEKKYAAVEKLVVDGVKVFPKEMTLLEFAEGAMKTLIKEENDPKYYFTLVEVQQKMSNYKDAMKTAEKGKALAEKAKDASMVNKFDYYIKALEERI